MLTTKDGWHYNDETQEFILDERGEKIPSQVCLCFAYEWSDCACGCTSWNNQVWLDSGY